MKYRLRQNGSYIHFAMNELSTKEIHATLTDVITIEDAWGWYHVDIFRSVLVSLIWTIVDMDIWT